MMYNALTLLERAFKLQIIQEGIKTRGRDFLKFLILALQLHKTSKFNT